MPRRGEIWWANLDPTIGAEIKKTRPCLVISDSVVNQHRRTVVIVPISSSPRAVAKERLVRHIENLSAEHLQAVENALREILELD